MIDRDEVLYVARLARLRLDEAEVDRMSRELSGVLDYIAHISELDLGDVEPTDHVVELENVLRADTPRPSIPLDVALANAPKVVDGGFAVPSPGG